MSRYEPLKQFLSRQAVNELQLTFDDVERTIHAPLPKSAREYRPWWANNIGGGHVQAQAWLEAGWKTQRVDMVAERLVFVRERSHASFSIPHLAAVDAARYSLEVDALTPAAAKLMRDYIVEMDGDVSAALARAVHEAAIARRGRLIDDIVANAPRMPAGEPDSVQLIREDRDAR